MADEGQHFGADLWEETVLYKGLIIRLWQEQGRFTNAFSNNLLKTVNHKIFVKH